MGQHIFLDSVSAISVDTTNDIGRPPGAHAGGAFLLDASTVTGVWTVSVQYIVGGSAIKVAEKTGINAAGLHVLLLETGFDGSPEAIPEVNRIFYDNTTAGSLTGTMYAFYG